jgi:serine/threonine protein kinase
MAVRVEHHAEPIPGYRLIERLGGGGFGEVWKAEAPGGLHKAIKFVYGDLEAVDQEDGARAEQELKALSRVKTVHHPYILSLERFDIIDGQLIIVMELADRTIWDRFRECRTQGLPGIPRDELLGYIEETAEALDLMNNQYQLQHLDIKPQNLFLMHNHVKVADFGLVKDLEGVMASVTGGVTPVYAAPETFDGWVSRFSDQYSLAIVYQELHSGQRPFSGTTVRQLVLQHLQAQPNLSSLSAGEAAVVARALAKNPDDRYPTCLEFVQELRAACKALETTDDTAGAADSESPPGSESDESGRTLSGPGHTREIAPAPVRKAFPERSKPARLTFPDQDAQPTAPHKRLDAQPPPLPVHGGHLPTPDAASPPALPLQGEDDGLLMPALVVGLGEMGLAVLKHLRGEIEERFGTGDALPHVGMFYADTDPATIQRATRVEAGQCLRQREVLLTRLKRPSYYLKTRDGQTPDVEAWLNPRLLYRMSRQQTTGGLRALGRLAFVDNFRFFSRRLQAELRDCCAIEPLEETAQRTGLGIRSRVPRVYVVTGLGGGTGSGMLIDVAYLLRHLLRELGQEEAEIVGVFLLPAADTPANATAWANAFAALTELNTFSSADSVFRAAYKYNDERIKIKTFTEQGAPFQRCVLFSLPPASDDRPRSENRPAAHEYSAATSRCLATAAFTLFQELASPLGLAADRARKQGLSPLGGVRKTKDDRPVKTGILFQTVGVHRIRWPRRSLLQMTARSLCRRLVQRWMSKDARPLCQSVQQWVQTQWSELELSQDQVIRRFQDACQKSLKQAPEEIIARLMAPYLAPTGKSGEHKTVALQDGTLRLAAVVEAMGHLEQLLGVPDECRPANAPAIVMPGRVENALEEAAETVGAHYEQKLAEIVVQLIEKPEYRLAGAEEAIRQFNSLAEQTLQHHEQLAKELHERTVLACQQLQALLDKPLPPVQSTPTWRTPFKRRNSAAQTRETEIAVLLRAYPKYRYQSLILQRVAALYVCLRGQFSDQLREVDFCRARLYELSQMFAENRPAPPPIAKRGASLTAAPLQQAGYCLFPNGCRTLEAAARQVESTLTPADLQEIDGRVQTLIRGQYRALVHVCMTSGSVLRALAPAMDREVQAFLEARLGPVNVTDLFLHYHDEPEVNGALVPATLREDLKDAYEKSAPLPNFAAPELETNILAVPPGAKEEAFRHFTRQALPAVRWFDSSSIDEILFYRERAYWWLADLHQSGSFGQISYRKMSLVPDYTPHSRMDIPDWDIPLRVVEQT